MNENHRCMDEMAEAGRKTPPDAILQYRTDKLILFLGQCSPQEREMAMEFVKKQATLTHDQVLENTIQISKDALAEGNVTKFAFLMNLTRIAEPEAAYFVIGSILEGLMHRMAQMESRMNQPLRFGPLSQRG